MAISVIFATLYVAVVQRGSSVGKNQEQNCHCPCSCCWSHQHHKWPECPSNIWYTSEPLNHSMDVNAVATLTKKVTKWILSVFLKGTTMRTAAEALEMVNNLAPVPASANMRHPSSDEAQKRQRLVYSRNCIPSAKLSRKG